MPQQLPFSFPQASALTREDFISAPLSAPALTFIDSWPDWHVPVAVLHGASGSGKSHLVAIWRARSQAQILSARALADAAPDPALPVAVEDFDSAYASRARDAALFLLLEKASPETPVLITGREPPSQWKTAMPDLASRFSAMLAFPLWTPDDALLGAIARKLFNDRQLTVPDAVIDRMIHSLERSPAAIRDFVARADEKALAEGRAISLGLVREMLVDGEPSPP